MPGFTGEGEKAITPGRVYPDDVKAPTTPLRWLRAWLLGASSIALGAGGHALGGGHIEPVFLMLLTAAASLAAYAWLRTERGMIAILTAVIAVQVVSHLTMSMGHAHVTSDMMLMSHAIAAVVLAGFLRFGEARVFARARRRYLRWLVAVRLALAGVRLPRVELAQTSHEPNATVSVWLLRAVEGRAPPVAACC